MLDAINNVFRKFSAFHDETGRLNVDGMNIISNDGSNKLNRSRSEERRVGKECRSRWSADDEKKEEEIGEEWDQPSAGVLQGLRYGQGGTRRGGLLEEAAHPGDHRFFFFKQKTAYELGLGIPAEPLFRSAINNVFRKFSAFHDETGRLNVDGMNIISNDGSNKLDRSRKARVSYKVQRTINASLNAATSTRAVSSNPNFVTRQKIEIIFG